MVSPCQIDLTVQGQIELWHQIEPVGQCLLDVERVTQRRVGNYLLTTVVIRLYSIH